LALPQAVLRRPPIIGAAPVASERCGAHVTALIVASALLMEQLDGTVLATALPTMARSFGVDPLRMNVALTSYLLSLAMFFPASGWIADRFGSRTVFRAAIALCAGALARHSGGGAHSAGHGRSHDVTGRTAGAAAGRVED